MIGPAEPTEALLEVHRALHRRLLSATAMRADVMPGLSEVLRDRVAFQVSLERPRRAYAEFCPDSLRVLKADVCEIRVFIGQTLRLIEPDDRAAQLLRSGLHEAAHLWAFINGIKDVSRGARYHNNRFGQHAVALGLEVTRVPGLGVHTVGLLDWARIEYADLLVDIDRALVMDLPAPVMTVEPGPEGESDDEAVAESLPRHVTAICHCVDPAGRPRRLRMSAGSWRLGPVVCGACRGTFRPVDGAMSIGGGSGAAVVASDQKGMG